MTTEKYLYVRPRAPNRANPFEGDLFQRRPLADKLTSLLKRLPDGAVFAIDAAWGEGKSWFGLNWHADLEVQKYRTAYIDAFANDYVEDPYLMISSALVALHNDPKAAPYKTLVNAGAKLGRALAPQAAKMVINLVGSSILGTTDLTQSVADALEKVQDGASLAVEKELAKRLKRHEEERATVQSFRSALQTMAAQGDTPIVVFIDELDRCRPDFAVKTIERIKHFFDVPNVVFVLLLNRVQLCASIKGLYGADLDADAYLSKFVQFSLTLPKRTLGGTPVAEDAERFCEKLLDAYGFDLATENVRPFAKEMSRFGGHLRFTLRDYERAVVLFSLGQPLGQRSGVAALPIGLKLVRPLLFAGVLAGSGESRLQTISLLSDFVGTSKSSMFEDLKAILEFSQDPTTYKLNPRASQLVDNTWNGGPDQYVYDLFQKFDLNVRS
jgi:KAP family P-loop domain